MRDLFLITSAIGTRFGLFDTQARLAQTLGTLESVREKCPDAKIVVIEMGVTTDEVALREELRRFDANLYFLGLHPTVRSIAQSDNWDVVKNLTEMVCTYMVLDTLVNRGGKYGRVFKLSGRYSLTREFDLELHRSHPDSVVFSKARPSQFDSSKTGGIDRQYMSRLWSFPASKMADIRSTYQAMILAVQIYYQNNHYVDIEHLLFLYSAKYSVVELDKIGVCGWLGPNGVLVSD